MNSRIGICLLALTACAGIAVAAPRPPNVLFLCRILDALEASPHAKNTYVVFAGDSGVARGSHGLIGKQNCYEHSMGVPLLIAGPGIPSGRRTEAMCYLFDVLPTLGKLCGVPPPSTSEGQKGRRRG